MDPSAGLCWLVQALDEGDTESARELADGLLGFLLTWEEPIELTPEQLCTLLRAIAPTGER